MTSSISKLSSVLVLIALVSACAGRPANPVMVDQVGDTKRNCASIETEMRFVEKEITRLIPETDKTNKNVGLGIAGAIFIVPLFFMDLSESEKIEVNALRQRYNRLNILATDKQCPFVQVTNDESIQKK
jgi:hypothetical protein